MDSLNRTLVLGLSGLAALLWLAALMVALFFLPGAARVMGDVGTFLAQNSGLYVRLMFAAVFAVLLLASLLLTLVAYSPQQSASHAVVLPRVPGGMAMITPVALAQYLSQSLADLPGVLHTAPVVKARGNLLDISMEVSTPLGVDLAAQTALVRERAQRSVSALGLELGQFRVLYQMEALPQQSGAAAPTKKDLS